MTEGELILYTAEDGSAAIQLLAEGGTVWLTQLEIATLFDTSKQNISLHIKNILAEGELAAGATVKESLTVQTEGRRQVRRSNLLNNLDMILAVGYESFDTARRDVAHLAADAEDMAALEEMEKVAKKGRKTGGGDA